MVDSFNNPIGSTNSNDGKAELNRDLVQQKADDKNNEGNRHDENNNRIGEKVNSWGGLFKW